MSMTYTDMLIALSNGKYTAAQIAEVCTSYNITPEQLYTDLYGNDNLTFVTTKNGHTVLRGVTTTEFGGYYGEATTAAEKAAVEMDTAINSNASGTATKTAVKTRIPVNSTLNQAGKVTLNTELTHIGGQTIAGTETLSIQTVGLALAAAGVGISAGKKIDSTVYNLNPDFWDEIGMSGLNPDTWGSITSDIDENDPLYIRWGGAAFDAIFDTNAQTGQTQMYLSEDQIAYMMGVLISKGVYNSGGITPPVMPSNTPATIRRGSTNYNVTLSKNTFNSISGGMKSGQPIVSESGKFITSIKPDGGSEVLLSPDDFLSLFTYNSNSTSVLGVQMCETALTQGISLGYVYYSNGSSNYTNIIVDTITINGISKNYIVFNRFDCSTSSPSFSDYVTNNQIDVNTLVPHSASDYSDEGHLLYYKLYGTAAPTIEGITDQPNATQFNASSVSDPSDISDILSKLKAQFPEWFDTSKGIRQEVIDENGDTQTIDYYPVSIPDFTTNNVTQPTGGTDNATQKDPFIDPDTWPHNLIQTIAQMLMQEPVTDKDDTTNPPDTGSGSAPIVTQPSGSATALWSIYNPTQAQIDAFGAWLWSNDFVDQLKKIFNDPMESIISLHKVFGTPSTGGTQNIAVGYLNSGVSSKVVTAQYTDVDCGSVQLSEYFGNVYDYKDTSIELYLPFIGIVPLSVSDVMRATIHVVYHIDILTGACLADVEVIRDAGAGGVLYQYSGDCAVHYPVSSGSYIGIVGGILSAGAGIAGTIASGGAAAPLVLGGASALMRMHTDVARSGGFSANAGAMGAKIPYLIISRPQTALPENYLDIEGIGSNKTVTLNTCAGYTRIKEVYLQGIGDATEGELNELETLLKAGVIFPITETQPNE